METGKMETINKIETIQLNKTTPIEKKEEKKTRRLTQFIQQYGKYIGTGLVILALVVVCAVSLADRIANREVATGVMMTVADLAKNKDAFDGEPLIRKDFIDILMKTSKKTFGKLNVVSNGILINDEIIDAFIKSKMMLLSVSLDGYGENHDKNRLNI